MTEPESPKVSLQEVKLADLAIFFEQGKDPEAIRMAAFTARDPSDLGAFYEHWEKILANPELMIRSVLFKGQLVGHVESFPQFGRPSVGFWLGKEYWGQGLATAALAALLEIIDERPLYARAATDNAASIRVLQKNGFVISGEDKGFAFGRGQEVEEYIFTLEK